MTNIEKDAKRFCGWAEGQGGESLPPTNEYELARIKHADGTFVIYRNGKGQISFSDSVGRKAWMAFREKRRFSLTRRHRRSKSEALVKRLIDRDGNVCFFCGCEFCEDVPPTLEHLLSIAQGGNNKIANLVLACEPCNQEAGSMAIASKIKMRDAKRDTVQGLWM